MNQRTYKIPWRSPKYLSWVRQQMCAMRCGGPSGTVHHIKGVGHYSGVGLTADDILGMPLCPTCHHQVQTGSDSPLLRQQFEMVCWTVFEALSQRVISIPEDVATWWQILHGHHSWDALCEEFVDRARSGEITVL